MSMISQIRKRSVEDEKPPTPDISYFHKTWYIFHDQGAIYSEATNADVLYG